MLKEQNIFCTEPGPSLSLALVGAHQLLRQHRRFSVITERLLSEGNGEAAGIRGNRVRDLNKIQSEAYRKLRRSAAWRKATEIYARAYNQSPEAVAFYEFTRTMQAYKSIIAENTTLVLSTDGDRFKFLKGISPKGDVVPASAPKANDANAAATGR